METSLKGVLFYVKDIDKTYLWFDNKFTSPSWPTKYPTFNKEEPLDIGNLAELLARGDLVSW